LLLLLAVPARAFPTTRPMAWYLREQSGGTLQDRAAESHDRPGAGRGFRAWCGRTRRSSVCSLTAGSC